MSKLIACQKRKPGPKILIRNIISRFHFFRGILQNGSQKYNDFGCDLGTLKMDFLVENVDFWTKTYI